MRRAWHWIAYGLSWPLFAAGALALTIGCIPLTLVNPGDRLARRVRSAIRALFRVWVAWLDCTGLVRIHWPAGESGPPSHPALYIANHPGLLDATFLLSRLPDTVCLVKPAILRNPLLGLSARLAGYVSTEGGVDSIRTLADRLRAGSSVLIFPEGTRTRAGRSLNRLKPGFTLIARRAERPIEILTLQPQHALLAHGQPAWPPPRFPNVWRIERAGRIEPDEARDGAAVVRQLEELWLRRLETPVCA